MADSEPDDVLTLAQWTDMWQFYTRYMASIARPHDTSPHAHLLEAAHASSMCLALDSIIHMLEEQLRAEQQRDEEVVELTAQVVPDDSVSMQGSEHSRPPSETGTDVIERRLNRVTKKMCTQEEFHDTWLGSWDAADEWDLANPRGPQYCYVTFRIDHIDIYRLPVTDEWYGRPVEVAVEVGTRWYRPPIPQPSEISVSEVSEFDSPSGSRSRSTRSASPIPSMQWPMG